MVFFALAMMWAYPYTEYKKQDPDLRTSIWKPLWDSVNYCKSPFIKLTAYEKN